MSYNAVFMGWNRAIPGREAAAGQLFTEVVQYLAGLQGAGQIDSFEPVMLTPHGGDLNGFILIRGSAEKLGAMMVSSEWASFNTRGSLLLDGPGSVTAATGDLLMDWMKAWTENIPG
jgi:hypothetical protein